MQSLLTNVVSVGNIPYDATEAQLSEIFSRAGQVLSFRYVFCLNAILMYDRETGRSKGYGFCEFCDKETAASALRNMKNLEFNGRGLRIDAASGERTKEEIRQMHMMMAAAEEESYYGPTACGEDAKRAISDALIDLPKERLVEFLQEIKTSLRNNPNETRGFLVENPQIALAILDASVICRQIDQNTALSLLHKPYSRTNDLAKHIENMKSLSEQPSQRSPTDFFETSARNPLVANLNYLTSSETL
ncbi:cleavage stimulation factor subunit 2 [Trichuris trichiura]|uniref:Cleavage stimulation factor subunit 2 n=1 Tax=Trichuris trichiura TaxID=36087 RepID=A0A077Z585_TRITR|nr:cleavage stimulation factor subunit 2 [Trichuris trichiura]